MNAQPEALRLADWLDSGNHRSGDAEIAAELRRLHTQFNATTKACNELAMALERTRKERDHWHARLLAEVNKRHKMEDA